MNIALCGRFHTDRRHQGGSAEVLLALAEKLSRKHSVTLFGRGKPTKAIMEMCQQHGIVLHYIPSDTLLNIFLGPIRAYMLLRRNFRNFDVIHSHSGSYAVASLFFRERSRIVTHVHEPSIFYGLKGNRLDAKLYLCLENWLVRFASERSHLTIACNEDMRGVVRSKWKMQREVCVIPNGAGDRFFVAHERRSAHVPLRILYVGRFAKQKRVERLIFAIASLKVSAHLSLVGFGPERTQLEDLVKRLEVSAISFEGEKSGDELRFCYRDADVFAISSDAEGHPLVILEAMASALPVVGTRVSGIRELVEGVGVLVDEPYADGFAKAFTDLVNDPDEYRRLSKNSIVTAGGYSWGQSVEKLETLYTELLVSAR